MMKNFVYIAIVVLIVFGVIFVLKTGGDSAKTLSENDSTQNTQKQKEEKSMSRKSYTSAPATLAEAERVGKKAKVTTNQGSFTINLFGDKAPKTVSSFIFLAKEGFYNGLTFHRIIPNFMIQGGDPAGDGTGGPGYQFEDEFDQSLTFSKPGLLAMANSGPGTNGSQFFVTVVPTTWLNNKHTIFGEVSEGYEVVEKISKLPTGTNDKPQETVVLEKIEII
jgi:cyclophilin family peptidyl-prolyl cis-trans isomerase